MIDEDLKREILKLVKKEFQALIGQHQISKDTIKQRHVGEGVRFLRAGLAADKPTTPEKDGAVYYATDENKLYIGDNDAWLEEEFT